MNSLPQSGIGAILADSKDSISFLKENFDSQLGGSTRNYLIFSETVTSKQSLLLILVPSFSLDFIVAISQRLYTQEILKDLSRALKPGGVVIFVGESNEVRNILYHTQDDVTQIFLEATSSGFVDLKVTNYPADSFESQLLAKTRPTRWISFSKPTWQVGQAQLLKKKNINSWNVDPKDLKEDDLIDETTLVGENDLKGKKSDLL